MTRTRPLLAAAVLLLSPLLSAVLAGCSSSSKPAATITTSTSAASSPTAGTAGTSSAAASAPSTASTASTATSAPSSTGALQVTIKNFAFEPASLTVSPGQTVTVVNRDSTTHTVTASDKSFDTGNIAPGATATFTAPQQAGAHPYICTIHPFMHGTLTVG
ncbi:cupredoxin family copper-binding protein [Kitasatospora sp. NPDC093558]|uniref:cupredoxin domain-containing protein n=1 Tax=Kitasatospora sp. NPDC093558 TaxID=3155201 RepID=UPI00341D65E4